MRFGQTSLSRGIATSAPAFAPKKGACSLEVVVSVWKLCTDGEIAAAATTAKAKQGFARKKKDASSGSGGGSVSCNRNDMEEIRLI